MWDGINCGTSEMNHCQPHHRPKLNDVYIVGLEESLLLWPFSIKPINCKYCSKFGEGNGTPLQHSWLENPMDREAWWTAVHGIAKSQTRLSGFTFTFHFPALEKEMATHSIVLTWRIPETVEPGGLPSVGSHRVRHDWSDLATAAALLLPIRHTESSTWWKPFRIN